MNNQCNVSIFRIKGHGHVPVNWKQSNNVMSYWHFLSHALLTNSSNVSFTSCRTSFTMILFLSVTRTSKFFHCNILCKTKGGGGVAATFTTLIYSTNYLLPLPEMSNSPLLVIFPSKSGKGNTINTNTTDPAKMFEYPAVGVEAQGRRSRFWKV